MALKDAICPFCGKQIKVNSDSPESGCFMCRNKFPTEKAIAKYLETLIDPAEKDADTFPFDYTITIEREYDAFIADRITVILMINGRPHPLPNGGRVSFLSNTKIIEIPIFTTDNEHTKFEGIILGNAFGPDIRIVWSAEFYGKSLGRIKERSNPTFNLYEKPGATAW